MHISKIERLCPEVWMRNADDHAVHAAADADDAANNAIHGHGCLYMRDFERELSK